VGGERKHENNRIACQSRKRKRGIGGVSGARHLEEEIPDFEFTLINSSTEGFVGALRQVNGLGVDAGRAFISNDNISCFAVLEVSDLHSLATVFAIVIQFSLQSADDS
jgi:hypothetical protein